MIGQPLEKFGIIHPVAARLSAGLFCVAFFSLNGEDAQAQHIYVDPRAEVRVTGTDNATLVETNREYEAVLNSAIGINTRIDGNRLRLALDYSLDHFYFITSDTDEFRQNAFGTLDAEVWEDHLTINGRASLRQQFIDQRGSLSGSAANRTANRRLVQEYTATSIFRTGLRDYADFRLTYRLGLQRSPADNLTDDTLPINFSDSTSHEFTASLDSGDRFRNFQWRFFADSSRVIRSLDVNDFRKERAGGEITLKPNRHLQFFGNINVTSNDFQNAILAEDGFGWETGIRWTPGGKLDGSVSFGKEGARSVWYGSLQYFFSARLDFTGSYTDRITANTIVSNDTLNSLSFNSELGITNTENLPIDETDPNFSFSDVDFRQRSAVGTFTLRQKRTTSFLSGNYEWRTFDNDSGTGQAWGITAGTEHKINEKTSLNARLSFRQSLFEDGVRVDDFIVGNLSWEKTISRYFRFAVSYDHSQRLSNLEGENLRENAITLYLRGTF